MVVTPFRILPTNPSLKVVQKIAGVCQILSPIMGFKNAKTPFLILYVNLNCELIGMKKDISDVIGKTTRHGISNIRLCNIQ